MSCIEGKIIARGSRDNRSGKARWLFVILAVLLPFCSREGHAQQETFDRESYYRAVEYCRGNVARPMALSGDQEILCFDGPIVRDMDISLASDLKENGLFVVRSAGGSVVLAVELAELLGKRHAKVVVYDYCLSACASYFLIASSQAYVLKGALVAWHHVKYGFDCPSLEIPRDLGPKKLVLRFCGRIAPEQQNQYRAFISADERFYSERVLDPQFEPPPESFYVRRVLRTKFEGTGVYPDVMWTWNPRAFQRTFKTKIYYEAYPESQEEVDDMAARFHLGKVIYDP